MSYKITLIPGDGIGPEITEATTRVLEATGISFEWDIQNAGTDVIKKMGTPLPDSVMESIKKNKVAIKGPVTTPVGYGFRSVNVTMRKEMDLYACVRPCKSYPGTPSRYHGVDLVIFRENTEDLYAGIEFEKGSKEAEEIINTIERLSGDRIKEDSGISIKPISVTGSQRIFRAAFRYARKNKRRKITAVHKANIMKFSDGLFLEVAQQVATEFPDIEFEDRIVDNMTMQLVKKPRQFDIVVAPNLYGDILSDLCAGLVGGLGLAPGANIGDEIALFEPTHGSAPKYKGLNKVNPMAMMLSGVMMLKHLGETNHANRLESAIAEVIDEGTNVTYDLKDPSEIDTAVGTREVANAVIAKMKE